MAKTDIHTWASRLIVVVCALGLAFVLGKYGVPVLMPFLLAGITVMFVRPWGKRLSALIAVKQGICCVFVLLVLLGIAGTGLYLGGYYLWREASAFYAWLYDNADSVLDVLGGLFATKGQGGVLPAFLQKLLELPLIEDFVGGLDTLAQNLTGALLERLGAWLTGAAIGMATSLPAGVLAVLVFLLSCFYLALDGEGLYAAALGCFSPGAQPRVREICDTTANALRGYLRAYGLLFVLTMAQLLIGFWIIGVRYAFLASMYYFPLSKGYTTDY